MLNEALAPGKLATGRRIYAVGDIHGCIEQLTALHALIAEDLATRPVAAATLLHIGDYVDRGPDSRAVLDHLAGPAPVPGVEVVNLLGNHEVMMLEAMDFEAHPGAVPFWLQNGGVPTLRSYGVMSAVPGWWQSIPQAHLDFLGQCSLTYQAGGYLFVHAGIRPELPLEEQDSADLLWIREPFLSWAGDLGTVVVHGHTPGKAPVIWPNRIGIDTGACFGGQLTCLVLEGDRMRFLAV